MASVVYEPPEQLVQGAVKVFVMYAVESLTGPFAETAEVGDVRIEEADVEELWELEHIGATSLLAFHPKEPCQTGVELDSTPVKTLGLMEAIELGADSTTDSIWVLAVDVEFPPGQLEQVTTPVSVA
ncbi:hypothetical protein BJ546DRAFT_1059301 [Cryomyces antarcticus]